MYKLAQKEKEGVDSVPGCEGILFQVGGPLWAISSAHDSSLHVYLPAC